MEDSVQLNKMMVSFHQIAPNSNKQQSGIAEYF